jgi:hypothetical protein
LGGERCSGEYFRSARVWAKEGLAEAIRLPRGKLDSVTKAAEKLDAKMISLAEYVTASQD